MKLHKILLTASILFGGLCASAQEAVTEYTFKPHWYGQAQFGAQETLGEGDFDILAGPNAQLAVGYNFNPVFGLRLAVNSWRSRGTSLITNAQGVQDRYKWKWNYIAPTVDAVFNMTNLLGGYNPERLVEVDLFGGIGANIAWDNKEANGVNDAYRLNNFPAGSELHKDYNMLGYVWDGTKTRFVGQFGFDVNFNVTKQLQVGVELMANVLNDHYNSKRAGNADWYFNGLVGVKYSFGPRYEKSIRVIEPTPCEPQIIEKIVKEYIEVPAPVVEEPVQKKEVEALRRDVFFKISTTTITPNEMTKVSQVAEFLKENPDANVVITGYADKGTGSMALNLRLAAKRAEAVANALRTKYGIPSSRMTVKSMGETEDQPYPDPIQNRVAICIAQ